MSNSSQSNIPLENVYYMLAYAFKAINLDSFKSVGAESFDRPENLLGAILHEVLKPVLRGGLYKTYEVHEDALQTVRGHILIRDTMRHVINRRRRLQCEFDEFTKDNLFNQILKAAMTALIGAAGISQTTRKALRSDLAYFSDVKDISRSRICWRNLRYQRTNVSYRVSMNFSRLIIDGELMGDKDGSGKIKLRLFTEETLHDVYEAFLREYFRVHHPEVDVIGKKQLRWDVPATDQSKMPKMETDVMIRKGNRILVIDAKYYGTILNHRFGGASYNSGNLYQIKTYVDSMTADPSYSHCWVFGLLLYAKTNEVVQPLRTSVHGSPIGVDCVDLNVKFPQIKAQLDTLLREFLP